MLAVSTVIIHPAMPAKPPTSVPGLTPANLRHAADEDCADARWTAHWVLAHGRGDAWQAREVFGRPFPEPLPRWDATGVRGTDLWVTEHETREEVIDRYRRVGVHSDATVTALAIDASGQVPWWPRPKVTLFAILIHMLTETSRHAGHADILREQLDGSTGTAAAHAVPQRDTSLREAHRATIERAAQRAANLYGSNLTGR